MTYDYKTLIQDWKETEQCFLERINALGKEGYRVVRTTTTDGGVPSVFMERSSP